MLSSLPQRYRAGASARGQALTEMALVLPLVITLIVGVIVLGMGIFFSQQVTNAAREGARYASLHSATSQCPTVSNKAPDAGLLPVPNNYYACDAPANRWPEMTAAARNKIFGMQATGVRLTACWSGYWTRDTSGNWASYDQIYAVDPVSGQPSEFRECSVRVFGWNPGDDPGGTPSAIHVINPRTGLDTSTGVSIRIDCSKDFPLTTDSDDMASNYAASNADQANQVTVLTCYSWSPPLAGFLLIPRTVTLQAVLSEAMEYQQ